MERPERGEHAQKRAVKSSSPAQKTNSLTLSNLLSISVLPHSFHSQNSLDVRLLQWPKHGVCAKQLDGITLLVLVVGSPPVCVCLCLCACMLLQAFSVLIFNAKTCSCFCQTGDPPCPEAHIGQELQEPGSVGVALHLTEPPALGLSLHLHRDRHTQGAEHVTYMRNANLLGVMHMNRHLRLPHHLHRQMRITCQSIG